jgi:hypothetical protein
MYQFNKILLLILIVTITGCINSDEVTIDKKSQKNKITQNSPLENKTEQVKEDKNSQAQSWEVTYSQSGGIAGLMEDLKINHEGKITNHNLKLNKKIINQLSKKDANDFYQIWIDIINNDNKIFFENNNKKNNLDVLRNIKLKNCRDCLDSSLKIKLGNATYTISANKKIYKKIVDRMFKLNKNHQM